ncbi:hypoxanthine phosphoribosyltransferase [bacterium]|nr:hypoxanthine phosphoribosyltransferase [bacterium]
MNEQPGKTLFSKEEIEEKLNEMAAAIDEDYEGRTISFIPILRGSFVFSADLIRRIHCPCEVDFLAVSSFEGTSSTGQVQLKKDLDGSIESKHVIILEDIVDTGLTLKYLCHMLLARNPASLRVATLLDRTDRRACRVDVDYRGFQIEDEFVVGYGLDLNQKYRNLPEIRALEITKR